MRFRVQLIVTEKVRVSRIVEAPTAEAAEQKLACVWRANAGELADRVLSAASEPVPPHGQAVKPEAPR